MSHTPAIDLSLLNANAIRALIAQGRTILRDRRLIPDASLLKRHVPTLSDADLSNIRHAARRFDIRPATLADEVLALRTSPQVVTLRSRKGEAVRLTPLVRVVWQRTGGTALTGTGHLELSLSQYRYNHNERPAVGEYVLVDKDGAPTKLSASSGSLHLYGAGFVRAWEQLPAPPSLTASRIILAIAGHNDTPQEALLTWCLGALRAALSKIEAQGTLINALFGRAPRRLSIATLIRPALAKVRGEADPKSLLNTDQYRHEWCQQLLRACELFLVGTNLIVPDLETNRILDVPLAEIWERYQEQEQLANLKAGQLRAAIVQRFGFTETKFQEERAWIRAASPVPTDAWRIPAFVRSTPSVLVTESCKVYIQGEYRCVVEGRSADLPHADQVVRRLLAVATGHRERISTLKDDLPMLKSLFADVADATIWDLATGETPLLPTKEEDDDDESDAA